jgi:preprotein translocase subunit SecA
MIPDEIKEDFFRMITLQSIDDKWMDHLYELDYLREGIYLRSYAQKDPLVEYKQEAFKMFSEMLEEIDRSILWALFRARFSMQEDEKRRSPRSEVAVHQVASAYQAGQASSPPKAVEKKTASRTKQPPAMQSVQGGEKVGRNDPCPCGSGKKYKKCCGKQSV